MRRPNVDVRSRTHSRDSITIAVLPPSAKTPTRLEFLARRRFVFREGTNWCTPHLKWLQHLTTDGSPLATEDRLIYREYHALLVYTLQRREELDRQIERLAEWPTLAPMVTQRQCVRGFSVHSAMVLVTEIVDWRRFAHPRQLACYLGLIPRDDSSGDRQLETPVFTASLRRHLNDEQYRALQHALLLRPEQGQLIPGGGGLRKLRWGAEGRGKRGGIRTIYYWAVEEHVCLMLYVYAKNEQDDLTPAQTRVFVRLVREEFQ